MLRITNNKDIAMNRLIHLFCLLSLLIVGVSCEKDSKTILKNVDVSELAPLPEAAYVLQEQEEGDASVFTVSWSETLFYLEGEVNPTPLAPVQYTLQVDKKGEGFANAKVLAVTQQLHARVQHGALNLLLVEQLGLPADKPAEIEFRILASYGQNQVREATSSNSLTLTITPFAPTRGLPQIYLVGDMNGWDNRNTDFLMFRENSDPNNRKYVYVGRIQANCYFKFLPAESLGSFRGYNRKDDHSMEYGDMEGGAFYNQTEGYKKITIDIQEMTYTVEDYDMSGANTFSMINFVGAFCNWGENNADPAMTPTAYDPHIWKLDITLDIIDYGVKFRANHSWDNRWCPSNPDDFPYGLLDFNPANHDNNISVPETGRYHIVFNDLTGHFVMLKK